MLDRMKDAEYRLPLPLPAVFDPELRDSESHTDTMDDKISPIEGDRMLRLTWSV